jgi:pyruvate formate lyase activating enzyme
MNRRQFFRESCALLTGAALLSKTEPARAAGRLFKTEARYYRRFPDKSVQCSLCPKQCLVQPGKRGACGVRANQNGVYYSLVYGRVAAMHNDPIEKKPFFHFLPGSSALSIATVGCNFNCKFCQNWDLSQRRPEEADSSEMAPADVVASAVEWKCDSIAYTYNEPVIYSEFICDTAAAGKIRGVRSVVVSNGFIRKPALTDLAKTIDAYKVDLKAFDDGFYRNVTGGRLQPVLDTLVNLKSLGVWTEIVYLVIPTLNDDGARLRDMAKWVYRELGPDVPLHFSRFYPQYKLKNLPPTPVESLERAWALGRDAGLHYVYLGNSPGHPGESTTCPSCKKTVIERIGFQILENRLVHGKCRFCGQGIPGVWV